MWLMRCTVRLVEAILIIVLYPILMLWAIAWVLMLIFYDVCAMMISWLRKEVKKLLLGGSAV